MRFGSSRGTRVKWKGQRTRAAELAAVHAETARMQVETLRNELGELHREVARRDVELLSALTRVAAVNESLRLELTTEHTNQARLARAIDRLAMFIAAPPVALTAPTAESTGERVPERADQGAGTIIGGSVDPSRAPRVIEAAAELAAGAGTEVRTDSPDTTIDLTEEMIADLPVAPATRQERPLDCEVHLQFGDRWITGFQIEETIRSGDITQFRLRRQVDGWVLPELFDESEVRVFMQPVVEATPR